MPLPNPLPDDPRKWDGWRHYTSENLYTRLCITPADSPTHELIEEHCRLLLVWWQKKLPLKNQPSNPLAQLLRAGLDDASNCLAEARSVLLNESTRQAHDAFLAARAQESVQEEFCKYLDFLIGSGKLTEEAEARLMEFGTSSGLPREDMQRLIVEGLRARGAVKVRAAPPRSSTATSKAGDFGTAPDSGSPGDPRADFTRMLRLSGLDADDMTDDQRDAFIKMAENLGLEEDDAEELVNDYLDAMDEAAVQQAATAAKNQTSRLMPRATPTGGWTNRVRPSTTRVLTPEDLPQPDMSAQEERARYRPFVNSLGVELLLIPSGSFPMGSGATGASSNEAPITKVHLKRFFMARFPITNLQYEQFDSGHARRRLPRAGDDHPVVHVSSFEAMKFCEWLSARDGRRYRLPSEAEWEYAARGPLGRSYPWGEATDRGDLANFADANTSFAWSDRSVNDGWPETNPVGSFPKGASPFSVEEMSGNVWEWCLDFFAPYKGGERLHPKGPPSGSRRVYRGGSWKSRFQSLRATTRNSNLAEFSCNDVGFRVVCETV